MCVSIYLLFLYFIALAHSRRVQSRLHLRPPHHLDRTLDCYTVHSHLEGMQQRTSPSYPVCIPWVSVLHLLISLGISSLSSKFARSHLSSVGLGYLFSSYFNSRHNIFRVFSLIKTVSLILYEFQSSYFRVWLFFIYNLFNYSMICCSLQTMIIQIQCEYTIYQ